MFKLSMVGFLVVVVSGLANANVIKNNCTTEWKDDHVMIEVCIKDQDEANENVADIENGDLSTPQINILEACKNEWGFDFVMTEACYRDEEEARIKLTSLISKGGFDAAQNKIMVACVNEWANQYQMINACYKEQNEAYSRLK